MTKAVVLGAGSWGTAFARVLRDAGTETVMWARRQEIADGINSDHENAAYLAGIDLTGIIATTDAASALDGADIAVLAVPAQTLRENLTAFAPNIQPQTALLSLAKGIEAGTLQRMSQVIAQVTKAEPGRIAVLSGPNLAREIASGQPAATVIACTDSARALMLQQACATHTFRVYTNADVVGCEIGGACKNIIALACGMASGVGMGDNTLASIITRGLAEIIRLGTAMGAQPATLAGLAGVGDLVATCMSPLSRNRSFGYVLGQGGSLEAAQEACHGQVAEGVKSVPSVVALADSYGVEMPLSEAVMRVCHDGVSVRDAVSGLLGRRPKPE